MFQRTVSFWRRLLGAADELAPGTQVAEPFEQDRRRSVRYATDQVVMCQPAATEGGEQPVYTARLRNVSSGGISFHMDRDLAPGALLSVQLPASAGEPTTTVLACVVHVAESAPGQWTVGCTFSGELATEEVDSFSYTPGRSRSQDQRSRPRHECMLEASYQLVAEEREENFPARVLNISTVGVGLRVTEPITVGKLLNVNLHAPGRDNARSLLCCAVHVTRQGSAEWLVGCNFIAELEESELSSLLF